MLSQRAVDAPSGSADRRQVLNRRVRLLAAATITYNAIEAVIAITRRRSPARWHWSVWAGLRGRGQPSAVIAWQFSAADPEARERTALRLIALSFFALAAYVTVESLRALLGAARTALHRRDRARRGLLAVMPFLS